jgi:hypothetical protein
VFRVLVAFVRLYTMELSAADRKFAQSLLANKKEEGLFFGFVEVTQKKKNEPRVLVISQHRLYALKPGETKVNQESHLLDLVEIRSPASNEITLIFKMFELSAITQQADDIIRAIRTAFELTFLGMPDESKFKIDVKPVSRLTEIPAKGTPPHKFLTILSQPTLL